MPITALQYQHIQSCAEDYFDYWLEKEEKPELLIPNLTKVFLGEFTDQDDFFDLQKHIQNPSELVKGIDNKAYGETIITIGEIQLCLLSIMTEKLKNKNLLEEHSTWDKIKLKDKLSQGSLFATIYTPPRLKDSQSFFNSDYISPSDGRTFDTLITLNQLTNQIQFNVRFKGHDAADLVYNEGKFHDNGDDDKHRQFIFNLKENGSAKYKNDIENNNLCLMFSSAARELLTHEEYKKGVADGSIPIPKIANINHTQLASLTSPNINADIKNGDCTLDEALDYSAGECIVLSHHHYRQKIRNKEATKAEFKGWTADQGLNITFPHAIQLINAGKLDRDVLREMTPYCRTLMMMPFYYQRVYNDPKVFDELKSVNEIQHHSLKCATIIDLIYQEQLSIKTTKLMTAHTAIILDQNPVVAKLVKDGLICLNNEKNELLDIPFSIRFSLYDTRKLELALTKLDKIPKDNLKKLIEDFFWLSRHKLLWDSGLLLLIQYIDQVTSLDLTPEAQSAEPKQLPLHINWLNINEIKEHCRYHLSIRANAILTGALVFMTGEHDNFENIKLLCDQTKIDIDAINLSLLRLASNKMFHNEPLALHNLEKYKEILGLNSRRIWSYFYCERLLNFPHAYIDKHDNLFEFSKELFETANQYNVPNLDLLEATLEKFIGVIKKLITANITLSDDQLVIAPALKIVDTINEAVESKEKPGTHWQTCLSKINDIVINEIKETKENKASDSAERENKTNQVNKFNFQKLFKYIKHAAELKPYHPTLKLTDLASSDASQEPDANNPNLMPMTSPRLFRSANIYNPVPAPSNRNNAVPQNNLSPRS